MEKHQKLGLALIAAGCALAAFCGLGLYYVNQRDTMPAMAGGAGWNTRPDGGADSRAERRARSHAHRRRSALLSGTAGRIRRSRLYGHR